MTKSSPRAKRFAYLAMSVAFIYGCAATAESPAEVLPEKNFQLQVGQSAHVAAANLTVGFQGVSSDSRCAKGEACVWEGDATVNIWLQQIGGAKDEFEVHTSSRDSNVVVYKGFSIQVVMLAPTPISSVKINAAEYIATFQVTPGTLSGDHVL